MQLGVRSDRAARRSDHRHRSGQLSQAARSESEGPHLDAGAREHRVHLDRRKVGIGRVGVGQDLEHTNGGHGR